MSLQSAASSALITAMENDLSPQSPNPLKDKIFHTDIRIQSIEDVPSQDEASTQNSRLVEHSSQNAEDRETQKKAAKMQEWWDDAIARYMGLEDGYEHVAVLLIKWDDGLDELKTKSETEELRSVFTDEFHYHCEVVEINVLSKPQHQINRYLSAFVDQHDGPNNLMIVYYTGHGVYREDLKYLEMTASLNPAQKRGFKNEARFNWNRSEEHLRSEYVEGDILTILDTCYSSNLQKSGKEDTRTFELLSACAIDATTASPGPNSFTRALIDALRELHIEYPDRPFTTFTLNQKINLNPIRHDTQSQLWFRLQNHERHIRLAPLKPPKNPLRTLSLPRPPRGYLTLRFALRDDFLNQEQIDHLAKILSAAFSNTTIRLGLRNIDWLGLKPARTTHLGRAALAMFAISQWRKVVYKRRVERTRQQPSTESAPVIPAGTFLDSTTFSPTQITPIDTFAHRQPALPSPTRKRSRDGDDVLPEPKKEKGLLVIPPNQGDPLSPPTPESSRGD